MVAKLDGPQFSGGANIAIKCPAHTYDQTVAFYRDTLALPLIEEESDGCIFQFGPNRLWIDKVPNLSHPDIWLEIETNDTEAASSFLKIHGVARRDEVENRREDFNGFFISDPAGVVHLVVGAEAVSGQMPEGWFLRVIERLSLMLAELSGLMTGGIWER